MLTIQNCNLHLSIIQCIFQQRHERGMFQKLLSLSDCVNAGDGSRDFDDKNDTSGCFKFNAVAGTFKQYLKAETLLCHPTSKVTNKH